MQSLAALAAATASNGDLVGAHRLLDELEERAVHAQDEWYVAEARTTRALVLVEAGRVDEGVAVALEAADSFAELDDLARARTTMLWVARTLARVGRLADAVAVYGSLLDEGREGNDEFTVASLELSEILETMGRPRAAARVRAELED